MWEEHHNTDSIEKTKIFNKTKLYLYIYMYSIHIFVAIAVAQLLLFFAIYDCLEAEGLEGIS